MSIFRRKEAVPEVRVDGDEAVIVDAKDEHGPKSKKVKLPKTKWA